MFLEETFFDNYNRIWGEERNLVGIFNQKLREQIYLFRDQQIYKNIEQAETENEWKKWMQECSEYPRSYTTMEKK